MAGRKRTVEPNEVVDLVRRGAKQIEAAKFFKVSRVRISQILSEHAPELLTRPKDTTVDPVKEAKKAADKVALIEHLNAYPTLVAAARALNLTPSGLYSKMKRLDIVISYDE